MSEPTRVLMSEDNIPTHWYNIAADMPNPPSPALAADGWPATPEKMGANVPCPIIEQEMSVKRWIPIPDEVRLRLRFRRCFGFYVDDENEHPGA